MVFLDVSFLKSKFDPDIINLVNSFIIKKWENETKKTRLIQRVTKSHSCHCQNELNFTCLVLLILNQCWNYQLEKPITLYLICD